MHYKKMTETKKNIYITLGVEILRWSINKCKQFLDLMSIFKRTMKKVLEILNMVKL